MNLWSDISEIKGIGPKKIKAFGKMGIYNVYDLLTDFPRSYEDWSNVYSIKDAPLNENVCIKAYVGSVPRAHYIRKGMTTYKLDITDGESVMDIIFFNNKYAAEALKPDKEYYFFGKVTNFGAHFRSMNSPQFSEVSRSDKFRPVYSQNSDISSSQIEKFVKAALGSINDFEDCIPLKIRNDYCLMSFGDAIRTIHSPDDADKLSEAKRRFVFEELFLLQIGLTRLKIKSKQCTSVKTEKDYTEEFILSLPFTLTDAQKKAISECVSDMNSGVPMNRLIQGDVGSGKTAVSASVIYNVIRNGYQAALMAPTEVLAQQHYKSFLRFFDGTGISSELLTGSTSAPEKKRIKSGLKDGSVNLLIGTHAIIQDDVIFDNLGLSVTDEQHRFGVNQRSLLNSKGNNPHVMVMSATPIPRTLSFIVYGDLDVSILDEMPAGRQKTDTFLINSSVKERAYGYVKKHLCEGYQGYIVCPLVEDDEEDEESSLVSSVKLFKEFRDGFFKGFNLGLLHGKMKPTEKKQIMQDFSDGKIDLLISTTVIEVGVDVPNAVIMVIENADRFGLSQIHQLRGRVGRGNVKSICILISDDGSEQTRERLRIITSTSDGFKIADADLKLRGPGDILGSRQHGLPSLKSANLITDSETVRETHNAAENLIKNNPTLAGEEYDNLKKRVNYLFSKGVTLS